MESLKNCFVCGATPVVDFEEHMIYCSGCSLSVQDTDKNLEYLTNKWNQIVNNIFKRLTNQKDMPPEFIKLVDDNFWDLI